LTEMAKLIMMVCISSVLMGEYLIMDESRDFDMAHKSTDRPLSRRGRSQKNKSFLHINSGAVLARLNH
jgi:hypothetical protein